MAETSTPNPSLRIASHNIQGMNSPVKRRKIFQYYHTHKIDILFLQKAHLPCSYFPYIFTPNSTPLTRKPKCNFSLISELKDPKGRFLLVKGLIDGQLYSLVSYYAQNKGQSQFFNSLFRTLNPLTEDTVIYGGDSNVAFDAGLDKTHPLGRDLLRLNRQSLKVAKQIFHQ